MSPRTQNQTRQAGQRKNLKSRIANRRSDLSGCSRPLLSLAEKLAILSTVAAAGANRNWRDAIPMAETVWVRNSVTCQLISEVLQLSGSVRIRVLGDSMFPSILPGDILVVERQDLNQTLLGQIVLFARNGRLFAHRIVGEHRRNGVPFFVTCGDSRRDNDAPVCPHEMLGCVTCIVRGERRISPRLTLLRESVSWCTSRSHLLTRCLLWLISRIRSWRELTKCPT